MKPEGLTALVSYRMEKSKEAIRAAEILLENEMLTFSVNRVYYSMFYAVQALLAADGVSFSKHGQVKGYFNRELIKTMILPKELGQLYNKAFEYRQKFDYVDFAIPDRKNSAISVYPVKLRSKGYKYNLFNLGCVCACPPIFVAGLSAYICGGVNNRLCPSMFTPLNSC